MPGPKGDGLYKVRRQMRTRPPSRPEPSACGAASGSARWGVAMEHFRSQYRITTTEQESIVREHLGRVLKEENGGFGLPASSIRVKTLCLKLDHHVQNSFLLPFNMRYMKNGTPITDVMIPVGITVGAMMFMAMASAATKTTAPKIPEAGIKNL